MTMSGAEMKRVTAAVPLEETDWVKAVMEHSDQLYHIAYSYLGNRNDALEALQETTCRTCRRSELGRAGDVQAALFL
ncbi:sigma factor [Paenibacillus sp. FSL R7-0337]|uniref:sigma factor n=1 Tax=Paenibacillus sp. FSL R7-0337 TaxID=1926588 RepID=UPI0009FA763F|nr:sigma factor [Paenibacillus sp. FSL R7-0337]